MTLNVSVTMVRTPDALMRLAACLHRRRYHVESLMLCITPDETLQEALLVLDVRAANSKLVARHLDQLVGVVAVETR